MAIEWDGSTGGVSMSLQTIGSSIWSDPKMAIDPINLMPGSDTL
jgi:hypothetical protein